MNLYRGRSSLRITPDRNASQVDGIVEDGVFRGASITTRLPFFFRRRPSGFTYFDVVEKGITLNNDPLQYQTETQGLDDSQRN